MKAKKAVKRTVITVLIIAGGLMLCNFLYLVLDRVMNGFVRDWFDQNYIYHEEHWVEEVKYYTQTIKWSRLKELVFEVFIGTVITFALIVRLISVIYASHREKVVIRATGMMISDFMRHDREASEVFPAEYAEVSLQMAEIKAAMQRQERLFREEEGRKNDLITYLAHDLKTPLTSVIGYLSLLDEAPDMPEAQKAKYVHITLDKARRLEKLINEFFEITRYNLHQIVLEKESVDIGFMLVQMTDEFYPILDAHGNTISLSLQPRERSIDYGNGRERASEEKESIIAYGDGEKLARVFNNILRNAIAYSYPDTEIRVVCREGKEKVCIEFFNRGKTIPAQKLDSIFEKFFRLDEARSTNSGGAGLGLAIAREIVTLHGGKITARSENEETSFIVELPCQM